MPKTKKPKSYGSREKIYSTRTATPATKTNDPSLSESGEPLYFFYETLPTGYSIYSDHIKDIVALVIDSTKTATPSIFSTPQQSLDTEGIVCLATNCLISIVIKTRCHLTC